MHVRKILSVLVIAGCLTSVLATDSRVLTMGRSDYFFMDDISIFRNPANINVYPNMIVGDLGRYVEDTAVGDTGKFAALDLGNRDPQRPYFGAIMSYSLNQSTDAGDQYPMLSLGAVFNRHDPLLDLIIPGSETFIGPEGMDMKDPVGKIDLLLGYALNNGGMLGVSFYTAFQEFIKNDITQYESKLFKGNVGVNWPITKTMDIEASVGVAGLTGIGWNDVITTTGTVIDTTPVKDTIADGDISVQGDLRLFSAMTVLNGDFVPHASVSYRQFGDDNITDVNGGVGVNLNIDRGFFWAAVEGLYKEYAMGLEDYQRIGGRVNFGIERNIVFDWLVMRLGATKSLLYETSNSGDSWVQNPEADASDEDHIAVGWAINIENRLKIDAVFAEDIFYTFTNLFSGSAHHLFTRFSATYSF